MTPELLAALGGAIVAILTPIFAMMRFFIKEFRPNGGGSTKDQLNRLEITVNEINLRLTNLENKRVRRKNESN
ncbi:MAG: hypothetical protein EB154_07030 [Nitrosopumilaceae archaeon]|nr:hypothetical protein [Nitrososphaerota archaeon]NDB92746.1 hypothetical protein [Nitrososphaeria archaeon]NDF27476.1 hypothetical protein [Nitrosopumilaceae archaeon]NDF35591.1 hypothetical protein [Nitrosopumilaceae archaeon]